MAYVTVPKDLDRVKNKVVLNLTMRQVVCLGIAAAIGAPFYFATRDILGVSNATTGMVILMLPVFFFALYEKDGLPLEKILMNMANVKFIRPAERRYGRHRSENVRQKQRRNMEQKSKARGKDSKRAENDVGVAEFVDGEGIGLNEVAAEILEESQQEVMECPFGDAQAYITVMAQEMVGSDMILTSNPESEEGKEAERNPDLSVEMEAEMELEIENALESEAKSEEETKMMMKQENFTTPEAYLDSLLASMGGGDAQR